MWNHLKSWWTLHAAWILGLLVVLWPHFTTYVADNPKWTLAIAIGTAILAHYSPAPNASSSTVQNVAKGVSIVLLSLIAGLYIAGCHKNTVTNVPAGVPVSGVEAWYSASNSLDAMTKAADSGYKIAQTLHADGVLKDGQAYIDTLQAFAKIFQTSQIAKNALAQIPQQQFTGTAAAGFSGYVNTIATALQQLNATGVTALKDPTSQANANKSIADISSALQVLQTIVKGAGS